MMTATADKATVPVQHLLDPLTAQEIEAATRILKQDRGLADSARFVYVTLREPVKDAVLAHRAGEPFEREAHIVIRERAAGRDPLLRRLAQRQRRSRADDEAFTGVGCA
jgi:Cu2+-containing amine oxidase